MSHRTIAVHTGEVRRTLRDKALGGPNQEGRRNNLSNQNFALHNRALHLLHGDTEGTRLKVHSLDLCLAKNRAAHHTDPYEQPGLIVRRGQTFDLVLTFDRDYNAESDTIVLQLTTGARPQENKGTLLRLPVSSSPATGVDDWSATVTKHAGKTVDVAVTPKADAIVGSYEVFVETRSNGSDGKQLQFRRQMEESIIVLFNAWCKDDDVYMENEAERNEYVMNDVGRIWTGSAKRHSGRPWNFGQFEDVSLHVVMHLFGMAELADGARSNPVSVIRCLSAMANKEDDNGVLFGRWTADYPPDSTVPWAWTGSVAILEEFWKTKKPVCFGQCWVFSGLVTTMLRALGIPTRSVTTFEAACDNDLSMTIDYHWNEEGDPLSEMNDSVWNFHVWNESFLKRPDLPEGFGGWQAHDGTAQEESEGVMRCGPAPVKAIKEGLAYIPYDTNFIFTEVNADKVHWQIKEDGSMEVLRKEKQAVGHFISAKAVGSNDRHDLTADYKYPEGSVEERQSVERAFRYGRKVKKPAYDVPEPDVQFTLDAPDDVMIGQDFSLPVTMKNVASATRNVQLTLSVIAAYYTGVTSGKICRESFSESLSAGQEKTCVLKVTRDMYEALLKQDSTVTIYMKGAVKETGRSHVQTDTFDIQKPELVVEAPEKVSVGSELPIKVTFTNPLKTALTGGVFHLEGQGAIKAVTVPYKKAIAPNVKTTITIKLTPRRSGKKEMVVNFSSDQLCGLFGSVAVLVE